ncbi:MAG: ADP-glyceromanno-heptose 6-epimerase [Candidatus Muirbacterium halophilum]|nr:ADP-glyceromanno-heptose 6-epimerase [Candidatus Muirbacterium halophilum]MCK9475824.1 ADP-glyceromanno-heptose 6-epimerase [Candidatus Muirbacterium halophilum]
MYIVTGGAGFIGSAVVWKLNKLGIKDILIVDYLGESEKWKNLRALDYIDYIEKDEFLYNICENPQKFDNIKAIIHMGACSSTTQKNASYLVENNFEYTKILAEFCLNNNIRFIYASSAATYGDGANSYNDDESSIDNLRPLNMYGYSKQMFDQWAKKNKVLDKLVGLKFFNIFGPNENHKDDMRSMVNKAYYQIKETGKVNLFKSDISDFKDGEQKRDFFYVKDAVDTIMFFIKNPKVTGLYNIGSGQANTWNSLMNAIFKALNLKPNIDYIDMPKHLKGKYQYFTQADISKLRKAGYKGELTSLDESVRDYVQNYLEKDKYLGDEM